MIKSIQIGYSGAFTLETSCHYPEPMMLKTFAKYSYDSLCWLETKFK